MAKRSRVQSSRVNRGDRERRRRASIPPHLSSPRSAATGASERQQLPGETYSGRHNQVPTPTFADPREYSYVRQDLLRIGALSGAIFAFMVVLALWLR